MNIVTCKRTKYNNQQPSCLKGDILLYGGEEYYIRILQDLYLSHWYSESQQGVMSKIWLTYNEF